jgi:hypothetical protein
LWPLLQDYARAARAHKATREMPDRMEHVWAYTTNLGEGEFIIGFDGHPQVDADRRLIELGRPVMEEIARQTGWTIRLVRFDRKGISIDTIGGS